MELFVPPRLRDGREQQVDPGDKVECEPEAIAELTIRGLYKRVGLVAGLLSQWLYSGLASAGFRVTASQRNDVLSTPESHEEIRVAAGSRGRLGRQSQGGLKRQAKQAVH
jgi:hypothetical protein